MIHASEFVEAARDLGFSRYSGVPCSFLTPFIDYVINDPGLHYVSSANEGDALAAAAGAAIGGRRSVVMMQNSGLGNAVNPLTSLAYVFRIPFLIIATHRGQPGLKDEPQHELMGQITKPLFDTMRVPWEIFPPDTAAIAPALARATDFMRQERRPYAFIMEKGTVLAERAAQDPARADSSIDPPARAPDRNSALRRIIRHTPEEDSLVIATTGYTGRELYAIEDRKNQFYMAGSMGCASSLGLGMALARPDLRVVIIDGDGAALMRMGNFATLGRYAGNNLIHILLDNEVHDSTGGQATVAGRIDFAGIARACGYSLCLSGAHLGLIDELFSSSGQDGPIFARLKIRPGTIANLPRPKQTPAEVLTRLMRHIKSRF